MIPAPALPPSLRPSLDALVAELTPLVPARLEALVLYGSLAKGKALTATSDANLLVVTADNSAAALAALAAPLARARRAARAAALLATREELAAMARAFPLKYEDMRRHHILLLGTEPFAEGGPSAEELREDALRRLLDLSLRLKRLAVDRAADRGLHLTALEGVLPGAILAFAAALDPAQIGAGRRREDLLADAAARAGTRPDRLLALLALKKGADWTQADEPADLGAELLATAEALRRGLERA